MLDVALDLTCTPAMGVKTYKGSCHCGRVKFETDLDLSEGAGKCNCTFCTKVRNFSILIKPAQFRLLAGDDDLTYYPRGRPSGPNSFGHPFCKHCGVRCFSHGHIEPIGGDFVSVMISALDDADAKELAAMKVRFADGRDNNWMNAPEHIAHL